MSSCCDKNPLNRSGINQSQRLLSALKSEYIQVDEREFQDWIFFVDRFSHYLKYFNTNGIIAGDWSAFFSNDISAIVGSIAVQEAEVYRGFIKERLDFIRNHNNAGNIVSIKQKLNELFAAVLSLSKALDNYLLKLPDKDYSEEKDFDFKLTVINLVQTKLSPALRRLLSYYFSVDGVPAATTDFLEDSDMTGWKVLNHQVVNADTIINGEGLSNHWWSSGAPNWNAHITAIVADESIFGPAAWMPDEYRRISHAVNHNLFSSIFDQYLQVFSKIVQQAEKSLLETLENWDTHPAHYTLFLSFLKLFRFAQSDINSLTQKHLNFYYKDVLKLKPKNAHPNHAHVLVELAKQTKAYALKQGTEYKAGKDSNGKEVVYAQDTEETFNKAKVALLKTVYIGNKEGKDDQLYGDTTTIKVNNKGRLFASPAANSSDGVGAELKSPYKEWHPYVNKKFVDGRLTDMVMPNAQIGFALASHYLFMAEGIRRVYIRLQTGLSDIDLLEGVIVDCYLTTEKGWYKISSVSFSGGTMSNKSVASAQLTFLIPGDAPAITNYNAEVHSGNYNVAIPLIKVLFINEDNNAEYPYEKLSAITITKIEIKVEVGRETNGYNQDGVKQLQLSNDFGPLDASKPFQPFGATPVIGNRLIIGSKEIFSKKNSSIKFNIEWKGANAGPYNNLGYLSQPDDGELPNASLKYLEAGIWKTRIAYSEIFYIVSGKADPAFMFPTAEVLLNDNSIADYQEDYEVYGVSSKKGFVAIQLTEDFGHKKYQEALTNYLINKARGIADSANAKPIEPYTPTIQSLYVSYSAEAALLLNDPSPTSFNNRDIHFFHIYPFGVAEQHEYLNSTPEIFLLPQFKHKKVSTRVNHIGEFYIGVENLKAQQSVNILFQVMEGSSNPLVVKPDEHIHWSYLSSNQWKDFDSQKVSDATRQLVQSGIISFIIPEDATTGNTMLPPNYLWLRAAVSEAAEAVSKLISVDAQAVVVTFQSKDNAENFLDTALPEESISKLKVPSSYIKKVVQPYSSFGGRPRESDDSYYVRVSERLRHKARAITIWDYEHLVLEAFPGLHKVKCLNHTKFEKNEATNQMEYNEVAPGYVTVITIPDLSNRNDTNPLRPYTNQNILLEVEEYLNKKISCHVKLKVKNPRFEEVSVKFKLKLLKGFDDFTFYANQLKEEITQYLTPWAFNSNADIQFGGSIHKSTLIDFIEERPYVDFITNVIMYHNTNPDNEEAGNCDEKTNKNPADPDRVETIEASTARSILVSAPASKHEIGVTDLLNNKETSECADNSNKKGKVIL